MLDQSTTIILSSLLGGGLTIIGGFLATHYSQSISKKSERRRELREIIETAYDTLRKLELAYTDVLVLATKGELTPRELYAEAQENSYKLEMLVELYIPDLDTALGVYLRDISEISLEIEAIKRSNDSNKTSKINKMLFKVHNNFRKELIALTKKKEYNLLQK